MHFQSNRYFAFALAGTVLWASFAAAAWEQTMTKGDHPLPISWPSSCFYYSINEAGSGDFPFDELRGIVRASFDVWEDVPCSYFHFIETDPASIDEASFHTDRRNANLLVWRESTWQYSSTVIAMTSINYDDNTGNILDADIEFNGVNCAFADQTTYPAGTELIDLRSTLAHEIGHTIGLDHNPGDPTTTMYGWGEPGSTDKRTLTADDIAGICAIYPADDDEEICRMPYCGLGLSAADLVCDDQYKWPMAKAESGCSTSPALAARPNSLGFVLLKLF